MQVVLLRGDDTPQASSIGAGGGADHAHTFQLSHALTSQMRCKILTSVHGLRTQTHNLYHHLIFLTIFRKSSSAESESGTLADCGGVGSGELIKLGANSDSQILKAHFINIC